ncbi:hypothetical protein SKAU_G00080470 [Synaphobranchus kaupii]|uniref:Uncharacterized protein n=1 Tax=Synaphobranchus kaupii TaxID=118154 RepID=A0A9Q1FUE5_SYNKA|nr:hypothetical protein SKAU_G00080470 [Synaphobranchus kaupii]
MRQMVVDLHKSGNGYRQIEPCLKLPIRTIINKFKANGAVMNLPRRGRKSSFPPRAVRRMV